MIQSDAREAVVISINDSDLTLELDGQKIRWPRKQAPKKVAVGDRLALMLLDEQTYQTKREELAKSLLNEILRNNEPQET